MRLRSFVLGLLGVAGLSALAAGCTSDAFGCLEADQCGDEGFCESNGYCSLPDPSCPSGRRFGDNATDGVANVCVPVDGSTGAVGATGSTTTSQSTGATSTGGGSTVDPESAGSSSTADATGSPTTGGDSTGGDSTGGASTGSASTGRESTGSESTGSESTGSESTGTTGLICEDVIPGAGECPAVCTGGCETGTCIVDCDGQSNCQGDLVNCPAGWPCVVSCGGTSSCQITIVTCADQPCHMLCTGSSSCQGAEVFCGPDACAEDCVLGCGDSCACNSMNC